MSERVREDDIAYIDSPYTVAMQYMLLFSQRTVLDPSVELSQKQELAVCRPAPFFCTMIHVTMYLRRVSEGVRE